MVIGQRRQIGSTSFSLAILMASATSRAERIGLTRGP
jgi:hypothetical protein